MEPDPQEGFLRQVLRRLAIPRLCQAAAQDGVSMPDHQALESAFIATLGCQYEMGFGRRYHREAHNTPPVRALSGCFIHSNANRKGKLRDGAKNSDREVEGDGRGAFAAGSVQEGTGVGVHAPAEGAKGAQAQARHPSEHGEQEQEAGDIEVDAPREIDELLGERVPWRLGAVIGGDESGQPGRPGWPLM